MAPKAKKDMAPKAKKPKNAYWLWIEDNKEALFEECGTNSLMQCGTVASQKWKALGEKGQEKWKKKHARLKAAYDKAMAKDEPAKKKAKKAPAPKKKPPVAVVEQVEGDDEESI